MIRLLMVLSLFAAGLAETEPAVAQTDLSQTDSEPYEAAPPRTAPSPTAQADAAPANPEQPNFIIVMTDDQGYQDLGCFGSPDIRTPRLDQLALEGMRFTSFYAQTVCGPSRAALMTGCYPLRVAQQRNVNEVHPRLHTDEITLAEVLKPLGYQTKMIGKWDLAGHGHRNYSRDLLPVHQGFDSAFWTIASNDSRMDLYRDATMIEENADMSMVTARYTDEAITFLRERQPERPFFLYLAHTMPHVRLEASEDFRGTSEAGLYGDTIEEIDHNVGRILDTLEELNIRENTYVAYFSDNGPWIKFGDLGGRAAPLRSGKTTCWEGGLRVPCIISAPGRIAEGSVCHQLTATIDLMPTIAELAGAEIPADRIIDGRDVSTVWHEQALLEDRPYFYYQQVNLRAVRMGDWKLVLPHGEGNPPLWQNHVLPEDSRRRDRLQLYNLADDIAESEDVASDHPDVVARLLELAERARNDIGDFDRLGQGARFFDPDPARLSRN